MKYNRIVGKIKKLTNKLKALPVDEEYRLKVRRMNQNVSTVSYFILIFSNLTSPLHVSRYSSPFSFQMTSRLLDKLYEMGLVNTQASLVECDGLTASAFARRRLPVMLVRLKYAQDLRQAVTFVEHGVLGEEVFQNDELIVFRRSHSHWSRSCHRSCLSGDSNI